VNMVRYGIRLTVCVECDEDGELVIRTNAQEFEIKVLSAKQQIEFSSPVSGAGTVALGSFELVAQWVRACRFPVFVRTNGTP